jgi:thiosulfate/3-mercaptopyruvate sulfurtransferase
VLAATTDPGALVVNALGPSFYRGLGPSRYRPVIACCDGGISATVDLFVLHQLGHDRLSLYGGSMGEWANDPALPIETD